jgi:riboflavin synthase
MFTGIVKDKCALRLHEKRDDIYRIFACTTLQEAELWEVGASIAINGACLTITQKEKKNNEYLVFFDVSQETLSKTNLGHYIREDNSVLVHLEPALTLSSSLGGHVVSGHVDSIGQICDFNLSEDILFLSVELKGAAYEKIAPYLVEKGSVCVDGVSLTVNALRDHHDESRTQFDLTLIPHTIALTHFMDLNLGDSVNIEADILAKHICRYSDFKGKQL